MEWHAEQNNDLLTKLITMDEGSAYLGECALVPYDSPIRQSGLLFYNTLFDENAACHLALGMGFADTINDFESKTLEECRALGVNDSMIHEDFMIVSEDMDIDAVCEDGGTHLPPRQLGVLRITAVPRQSRGTAVIVMPAPRAGGRSSPPAA